MQIPHNDNGKFIMIALLIGMLCFVFLAAHYNNQVNDLNSKLTVKEVELSISKTTAEVNGYSVEAIQNTCKEKGYESGGYLYVKTGDYQMTKYVACNYQDKQGFYQVRI